MKFIKLSIFVVALFLTGCSMASSQPSYDETKKMVTDALQTEDGKKAIRELLADPAFRDLVVLDQAEVKQSIENTLLSEDGQSFWKDTFHDPTFTETFAKSMKEQQKSIMKDLMKDAAFQKELAAFFSQPDMQKEMETLMKGAVMREEIAKIVEETIDSPLLESKWQALVKSAGEGTAAQSGGGGDKSKQQEAGGGSSGSGGGSGQNHSGGS